MPEQKKKPLQVFNTREGGDGNTYFDRVGAAFVNKDGSLNVILNSIPLSGKLHIREAREKPAA